MTLGLDNLVAAEITEGENKKETYGDVFTLAEAMTAELSVTTAEGVLYADDAVSESVKEFVKGAIKLGIKELGPENTAKVLGQKIDGDKVVYGGENDEPPYLAVGFRAKKTGGKYRYIWLYKVKFKIPTEKYQTKGESVTFNTPEIEGEFFKNSDGRWKADYTGLEMDPVAQSFLKTVREFKVEEN